MKASLLSLAAVLAFPGVLAAPQGPQGPAASADLSKPTADSSKDIRPPMHPSYRSILGFPMHSLRLGAFGFNRLSPSKEIL